MTASQDACRLEVAEQTVLVIDIGGTHVKFGYSMSGKPHEFRRHFSTEQLRRGDPIEALAAMVKTVSDESGMKPCSIVAAVPGFIDTDSDRVLFAGNILGLNGRLLASELTRAVGCPVFLERDAVLLLTGEVSAGAARGEDHVLGIFFGTGIGAAYLHNGEPFRGGGWALEIGLMPFCGEGRVFEGMRDDCLEAYASGRALQGIAERHGVAINEIFIAAAASPSLEDELALFVRCQAIAVGAAVAMFSPRTVLLGGGVLEMDGFPKATLIELITNHSPIAETGRTADIRWCHHGWVSVLHGAPAVVAGRLETRSTHRENVPAATARQPG